MNFIAKVVGNTIVHYKRDKLPLKIGRDKAEYELQVWLMMMMTLSVMSLYFLLSVEHASSIEARSAIFRSRKDLKVYSLQGAKLGSVDNPANSVLFPMKMACRKSIRADINAIQCLMLWSMVIYIVIMNNP